jgi:hypothetical protein
MVAPIAHRVIRRLPKMHSECEQLREEPSKLPRHSLALALQELQRLASRIPEARPGREEHVESELTELYAQGVKKNISAPFLASCLSLSKGI